MTDPAFTVLLPVHRPPAMLPFAINSVLAQARQDFELFVICDGTPPETVTCAQEFAAKDPRIRVFSHPKGEGNGDIYRDQALREARGTFVCQIGDDDLWLPRHLDEMAKLLDESDFGNLAHVEVATEGTLHILTGTLADASLRQAMLNQGFNLFGPTVAGYRLEAYRALPVGWAPPPPGAHSDHMMWRRFLAQDRLRFNSRIAVTSLKFANALRREWPLERRRAEVAAWAARLSDPVECDRIAQAALSDMSQAAHHHAKRIKILDNAARAGEARIAGMNEQLRQADAALKASEDRVTRLSQELDASADRVTRLSHELEESADRVTRSSQKLNARADRAAKLSRKLKAMRRSWSWRLTRPFRKLARRIGRSAP